MPEIGNQQDTSMAEARPKGEDHQVRVLAIRAGISFELARRLVRRLGDDAEMTEWAAATLKRRH